jgi:hypothetical protein
MHVNGGSGEGVDEKGDSEENHGYCEKEKERIGK